MTLKVTRSHIHYKSSNIPEKMQSSNVVADCQQEVTYGRSNRANSDDSVLLSSIIDSILVLLCSEEVDTMLIAIA